MHCGVLQHTATHCITPHRTASHRIALHHTASHRITLQHIATHGMVVPDSRLSVVVSRIHSAGYYTFTHMHARKRAYRGGKGWMCLRDVFHDSFIWGALLIYICRAWLFFFLMCCVTHFHMWCRTHFFLIWDKSHSFKWGSFRIQIR